MAEAVPFNSAGDSSLPRRISKPWGHELWFALTDRYAGKIITVLAGHRLSLQYHRHKDETSYLVSGRMTLVRGRDQDHLTTTLLEPGATWRNEPGIVHTVEALEDATFFEVSTPELDDVVRLEDAYGRQGTSAPLPAPAPFGYSSTISDRNPDFGGVPSGRRAKVRAEHRQGFRHAGQL